MNGSEHSIGGQIGWSLIFRYTLFISSGVGYAAEVHLYHRSTRFANMETALKQPNGVVAISLFLNVIDWSLIYRNPLIISGITRCEWVLDSIHQPSSQCDIQREWSESESIRCKCSLSFSWLVLSSFTSQYSIHCREDERVLGVRRIRDSGTIQRGSHLDCIQICPSYL